MSERTVAGLRCSEVLAQLSDYVDGELDGSQLERVEAHLRGCPNSAPFGKNFSSMVVTLRNESADLRTVDPTARRRLARQRKSPSGIWRQARGHKVWRRPAPARIPVASPGRGWYSHRN